MAGIHRGVRPSSGAASPDSPNAVRFSMRFVNWTLLRPRTGALRLCSLSRRLLSEHALSPNRLRPGRIPRPSSALSDPCFVVFIRGEETKTPPPSRQWGSGNLNPHLKPDCHAAQQQRVRKQQIPVAIHVRKLATPASVVKSFFPLASDRRLSTLRPAWHGSAKSPRC